jgi:hypothetical protein
MKKHHALALTLAGAVIALLALDLVVRTATGDATWITDDTRAGTGLAVAMSLLLAASFAACASVLHEEAGACGGLGRTARVARRAGVAALVVMAVGQGLLHPVELVADVDPDGAWAAVSGLVALLGLLITFLSALVLGLASVRRNRLGVGGRVLSLLLPVVALTGGLAVAVPQVASPALCTAVVLVGFATLGLGTQGRDALGATPLGSTV